MRLRDVEFPPVMNASGTCGFFGEGYPYHRLWKIFGLTFNGCGFIAKTVTVPERLGNMPLKKDGVTPQEWNPQCIYVDFWQGLVVNAVGLSNKGINFYLNQNLWQQRSTPFKISFASAAPTHEEQLAETEQFVTIVKKRLPEFRTRFGIEYNPTCPNTGHTSTPLSQRTFVRRNYEILDRLQILDLPVQAKLNLLIPPADACALGRHPALDAITQSNTVPFGEVPDLINWSGFFGTTTSPLKNKDEKFGGGGLSGWPLNHLVCDWIRTTRSCGFNKPISASGGIYSCAAIRRAQLAGANDVQLGTVAMTRPWRMPEMIRRAHEIFGPRIMIWSAPKHAFP